MWKLLSGLCVAGLFTGSAMAATIDLTDGVFGVAAGALPTPSAITETSDGVTFTFTAIDNLVGGPRWINVGSGDFANGLQVGGGGDSTLEFNLTVDADVTLNGYATNEGGGFPLGTPIFDLLDGATVLIDDGQINDPAGGGGVTVDGLLIALTAGTTYTFDIADTGAGVQGFFSSFEFTVDSTTPPVVIPLPAGLPLLLGGFAVMGFVASRRTA